MRSRRQAAARAVAADAARDTQRIPIALPAREGRDAVLVIAHPPLRVRLAELAGQAGFTVLVGSSGLESIQLLEKHGAHIAYAILSSDEDWVVGLKKVLADEYPEIKCLMLIA